MRLKEGKMRQVCTEKEMRWKLHPSTKEKNELHKGNRNVRESHVHEERAIINSGEEEKKKRAERSVFILKKRKEENESERAKRESGLHL